MIRSPALLVLATTLVLAACSDSVGPSPARPVDTGTTTPPPPPPPPPQHTGPWTLALNPTRRPIAVGDSVWLDASVRDAQGYGVEVPITWTTSDSSVAVATPPPAPAPQAGAWIRAVGPGVAIVVANAPSYSANAVTVEALSRTSDPSTLVVDDFRVLAVWALSSPTLWYYAPRLTMHDASFGGGSAVIGVQIEITGQVTTPWCATRREVGVGRREIFHVLPDYPSSYEWPLDLSSQPLPSNGPAVAHLTVRTGVGFATTMTVVGPIEVASNPVAAATDSIPVSEELLCK